MDERELWRELGQQLRVDAVRASAKAGSGHPTSSMSAADLAAVLLAAHLRYDFDDPHDPANDRLVFSKGHASPLVYGLFRAAGALSEEEFGTYRQFGSRLQGHPVPVLPWVDVATGSLGPGAPDRRRAWRSPASGSTASRSASWVICGDSEMAEGSMWEAAEHAAFYELDNLTAIVDVNRLGQRGETMHGWDLSSYTRRFEAFGWHAIEIDGHDVEAIDAAYREAEATTGRPTAIVARTIKGKGYSKVENENGWHGKAIAEEAIEELGGIRNIRRSTSPKPEPGTSHRFDDARRRLAAPTSSAARSRRARRTARRSPRSAASDGDVVVARRRGLELDVRRDLREGASRAVRRDVHRRAADGRGRGRDAGARLEAVLLDVRRVPHPRVRLRPDGRRQPGDAQALRLARRRLDRRGRPVADGSRGSRRVPRDPRLDRSLPVRRQPDGGARPRDGGPRRGSRTCARRAATRRSSTRADETFPIGGSKTLRDGDDVAIVAAGITLHEALRAAETLAGEGIAARVIDCYSVKPIDAATLDRAPHADRHRRGPLGRGRPRRGRALRARGGAAPTRGHDARGARAAAVRASRPSSSPLRGSTRSTSPRPHASSSRDRVGVPADV